jgi:hypothetical protein
VRAASQTLQRFLIDRLEIAPGASGDPVLVLKRGTTSNAVPDAHAHASESHRQRVRFFTSTEMLRDPALEDRCRSVMHENEVFRHSALQQLQVWLLLHAVSVVLVQKLPVLSSRRPTIPVAVAPRW